MTILQVCAYAAPYEGNFIKSLLALDQYYLGIGVKTIYAFPQTAKDIDWCVKLSKEREVYYLPLKNARFSPSTYNSLKSVYLKHPDLAIVHSHFELYDIPVVLTAKKNMKVFWHLHDAIAGYKDAKSRIIHKIQYGLFHKNAVLISVSKKHKRYVEELGFPTKNTRYVPNAIDLERLSFSKEDKKTEYDFLLFGWEFYRKGVDLCFEACKLLDCKYRVAIIGGEDIKEIQNREYSYIKNVEILSPTNDINALYSSSRAFLHISRAEGLSYALLEALYAGLPVVCSDIEENGIAFEYKTVFVAQSENPKDIAKKMISALENNLDEERTKVHDEIKKYYSLQRWVKEIEEIYGS